MPAEFPLIESSERPYFSVEFAARIQGRFVVDSSATIRTPRRGWGATVGVTIALQWLVVVVVAGLAGLGWGPAVTVSLFCGGAAVALPNSSLALWLSLRRMRNGGIGVTSVMAGELLKLGFTIALLVLMVVQLKPMLSWLAVVVGVIAALKAQWLAVWVTRDF